MRRTWVVLSYQRGGWSPGSKHQKHVSMNPTSYLYRFPGPRGPGPYTMKYWWTLGCFPTGLSSPFRLDEFLSSYQKEHVPIEVEEWLNCFLRDPVNTLKEAMEELQCVALEFPYDNVPLPYRVPAPLVKQLAKTINSIEQQLGVKIPLSGVRGAMGSQSIRERLLESVVEYNEAIGTYGSTPHRRCALDRMSADCELTCLLKPAQELPTKTVSSAVGDFLSVPRKTSPDESKLLQLFSTFAEGCAAQNDFNGAFSLLSDCLAFAHDEDNQSHVHANICIAALHEGRFEEALYHGREAALLVSTASIQESKLACRGYRLWATAVAYQDDFKQAYSIVSDALTQFPDDVNLQSLQREIHLKTISTNMKRLRQRYHMKSQLRIGIERGAGKLFDNEFDWVQFKDKLYPPKMNPSTNEMGSVFRRVGDLGGAISTSRSSEIL